MNRIISLDVVCYIGGFVEITMPKESSWSPDVFAKFLHLVIS